MAAVFLLLLLAACAAPPPAERIAFEASGTAIVRAGVGEEFYVFGAQSLALTRVDDTSLVDQNNTPLYRSVEVYPGLHTIHFIYEHKGLCLGGNSACAMRLSREGRLTFEAKPGRVYRVAAVYRKGKLWSWIVDEKSNLRVAGSAPDQTNWAAGSQPLGYVTQF